MRHLMLTAERLRELLSYDAETGTFKRKVSRSGARANSTVGHNCAKDGYCRIRVDGRIYLAHRLAYLYAHGEWPKARLDHVNCVPLDNRIANLRLCDQSQNSANARRGSNNTSGFKGVTWDKKTKRWRAQITVNRRSIKLGRFPSPEDAHAAYVAAAEIHFGEFARAA
jgi:hypothetical protein